jgi:hypothetical protein
MNLSLPSSPGKESGHSERCVPIDEQSQQNTKPFYNTARSLCKGRSFSALSQRALGGVDVPLECGVRGPSQHLPQLYFWLLLRNNGQQKSEALTNYKMLEKLVTIPIILQALAEPAQGQKGVLNGRL